MQHHYTDSNNRDELSTNDWHSNNNVWQYGSTTSNNTPSNNRSIGRLTGNILSSSPSLPTLPPVQSTSPSLLQSRYYPSSSTTSTMTSTATATAPSNHLYQPYPTLSRSNSSSLLGSNSNYRSLNLNKPLTRPRLTTTLWEDESTLCYQVDSRGICVARRQDNDMINGTKLLNVAGMSRGKRDGILKNERGRIVVKVGAMHLKGVWIPFVRAKALASQFKILDVLYPIFSDDPASFLYPSHFHQMSSNINRFNNNNSSSSLLLNNHNSLDNTTTSRSSSSSNDIYQRYSTYNNELSSRIPEITSVVDNIVPHNNNNDTYGIYNHQHQQQQQQPRGLYYSQQDHHATTATTSGTTSVQKRSGPTTEEANLTRYGDGLQQQQPYYFSSASTSNNNDYYLNNTPTQTATSSFNSPIPSSIERPSFLYLQQPPTSSSSFSSLSFDQQQRNVLLPSTTDTKHQQHQQDNSKSFW